MTAGDAVPPLCPDCGQPGSEALAGAPHGWECRNEACPEYGQALQEHEPPPRDAPEPGRAPGLPDRAAGERDAPAVE